MYRERSNIFFVFIFPLALILLIGAQFGGGVEPVVGIYAADDGRLSSALVTEIESVEGIDVQAFRHRGGADDVGGAGQRAGRGVPSGRDG